jgi:hypothetical protein
MLLANYGLTEASTPCFTVLRRLSSQAKQMTDYGKPQVASKSTSEAPRSAVIRRSKTAVVYALVGEALKVPPVGCCLIEASKGVLVPALVVSGKRDIRCYVTNEDAVGCLCEIGGMNPGVVHPQSGPWVL